MMKPVEGTILTVARVSTEQLEAHVTPNATLTEAFDLLVKYAKEALDDTPNQLPILKEANVVDSGGMGLLVILEGVQRFTKGEPMQLPNTLSQEVKTSSWQEALIPEDEQGYGYDVQFLMIGKGMDVQQVRADIATMGWSPLVDGDSSLIKVHVHVHNPAVPIDYAIKLGVDLDDVVVENMQAQYLKYVQERADREAEEDLPIVEGVALVSVALGDGLRQLMLEYGVARVINGGQTMNPSVEDFLKAVRSLPNQEVILLPNNRNVVLTAMQASQLITDKQVKVVPSKTIPQGIMAILAYNDTADEDIQQITTAMTASLGQAKTLEITTASRNVESQNIREGEWLALLDDVPQASGTDLFETVKTLLHKADVDSCELLTVYYGQAVTLDTAQAFITTLKASFKHLTIELFDGGQPLYPYIMSLE
jgi:uncharacterized protein